VEKFTSLADVLGVPDPVEPDAKVEAEFDPNVDVTKFANAVLSSRQYRESVLRRIIMDELPPQIETLFYHYAKGKPVERFEVKDTTNPLEDMSVEQLEARALQLVEMARKLRASDGGHKDTVN
jgi:hypothetical protein